MTGYELCHVLRQSHGDGLPLFLMSGDRTTSIDRVAGLLIGKAEGRRLNLVNAAARKAAPRGVSARPSSSSRALKSYGNRQECVGSASTFVRVAAASSAEGQVVHTLRGGEAAEQTANAVTNAYNERSSAVFQ